MALWSDYMKDVQRLLNDSKQELFDPFDLNVYINKARRHALGLRSPRYADFRLGHKRDCNRWRFWLHESGALNFAA